MREVKRPVFSFRLNLDNPDHKKAWEILQSVPDGQKSSYLVQVILKDQENNQLEKSIPADSADAKIVSNQLLQVIRDVPKAVLQDYTTAIATQKGYLGQQQIFFSSIAVILLIISLFHIVNSMSHTILTRRREYGIIRAIGITDGGFYKMILQTGILYGLLADVFIYLIYNRVLRRVMNYYLAHVLQFLHYTTNIPNLVLNGIMVLNVVIAVVAVMFPAWKMGKENIISEIRR